MSSAADFRFMARAIRLARRGLYTCDPNPRVGCVLTKGGKVVGEGFHLLAGGPHAEPAALNAAGGEARGATAYVSLEPCCHHGRTPPCTEALIRAGVSRVVAAMADPNPKVAGRGLAQLEQAGIKTECGLMEPEARALNPGFIKRMSEGRPFLRCKMAMSLDGRTAMAGGESKWITSEAARQDVQHLRARSSAVMTGVGTLLTDDPSLNVRLALSGPGETPLQPARVVLDSGLRFPLSARMLGLPGRTLVFCTEDNGARRKALEAKGAAVTVLPAEDGRVDPAAAMACLAGEEINEVLLEAGPTLAGALLQAGLVDELVVYMAPHLMGDGGNGLFRLPGLEKMADRVALKIVDIRALGPDWRITAVPEIAESAGPL